MVNLKCNINEAKIQQYKFKLDLFLKLKKNTH